MKTERKVVGEEKRERVKRARDRRVRLLGDISARAARRNRRKSVERRSLRRADVIVIFVASER